MQPRRISAVVAAAVAVVALVLAPVFFPLLHVIAMLLLWRLAHHDMRLLYILTGCAPAWRDIVGRVLGSSPNARIPTRAHRAAHWGRGIGVEFCQDRLLAIASWSPRNR